MIMLDDMGDIKVVKNNRNNTQSSEIYSTLSNLEIDLCSNYIDGLTFKQIENIFLKINKTGNEIINYLDNNKTDNNGNELSKIIKNFQSLISNEDQEIIYNGLSDKKSTIYKNLVSMLVLAKRIDIQDNHQGFFIIKKLFNLSNNK